MKTLRRGLPFFAMILAALTATVTSAYYTDMIQEEGLLVQSADISFGDEKGQISANTEDFYERLVPLKEGESFDVSFSAPYKGNTVSYVVPRLELKADGFEDGDTVTVTDGVSEAWLFMMAFSSIRPGTVPYRNRTILEVLLIISPPSAR